MKRTQSQRVLDYMKTFGSITAFDAFRDLGVMRLAARISDLRKLGYAIKSETITVKNRFDEDCCVKEYSLEVFENGT